MLNQRGFPGVRICKSLVTNRPALFLPPAARGRFSAKGDRCRLQVQVESSKTSSTTKPSLIGSLRRRAPWTVKHPQKLFIIEKSLILVYYLNLSVEN
jgi:hypothetical protein